MSLQDLGIFELSLRHLKAVRYVAEMRSVSNAAKFLNRSQTAITLAINDVETRLDVLLFNRTPTGMTPTVYGEALSSRIALAGAEFEEAGTEHRRIANMATSLRSNPIFSMEVSYKRLAALIALQETRDISAAATILRISNTAIYKSIHKLEDLLELKLFQRHSSGFSDTPYCSILVRHIKLAFAHLRHAIDELASLDGATSGRICVGMLPYSRTILTPRAITRLLDKYPNLKVSTQEGIYSQLEASLRNGDLDLIVGATRPIYKVKGIVTECLFKDRLAVIARSDHDLAASKTLSPERLFNLKWVLPARQTPARVLFDQFMKKHHLAQPVDYVETCSLATVRGLLLESDRVALLSEHQIYYEKKFGLLTVLPIDLEETYRPIGLTMRANTNPSPGTRLLLQQLRLVAQELRESHS